MSSGLEPFPRLSRIKNVTQFDLIVALIILVSIAVGFVRGATRELVTALSFVLAAAISLILVRYTAPLFRPLIDPDWVAVLVAILVVFLIAFVLLRLLGGRLSHGLLETPALGTVDRGVGAGIGVVRALIVLGAFSDAAPGADGVSVEHVLEERLGRLGIPVLAGVPAGHVDDNLELPLGRTVHVDATDGTLAFEDPGGSP